MGFLSAYEGVEHIPVGGGYWVDVKKCLSTLEMQRAEKVLTGNATIDPGTGRGSAKIDNAAYQNEVMAASIVAWNLDDDDGTVWALQPEKDKRRNIARLPGSVFAQIWKVVDDLNGPDTPADRQQFLDDAVGGDPDGDGGATDAVDVPDGTAAVAAAGPAQG